MIRPIKFLRSWLLRRPIKQARTRVRAEKRPCVACGRLVAHTQAGTPYVHRCRAELLRAAETLNPQE